jgi:Zn-finger nucleic acid-binding protein
MRCPRCKGTLTTESYEGIKIERCWDCHGAWIPMTRLSAILETRDRKFSAEELEAYRSIHEANSGLVCQASAPIACLECGATMTQTRYPYANEVIMDRCPEGHGIWLDHGELEHIQMAVEEEEDEVRRKVAEKGLKVDSSTTDQIKHEQDCYAMKTWQFFSGRRHRW